MCYHLSWNTVCCSWREAINGASRRLTSSVKAASVCWVPVPRLGFLPAIQAEDIMQTTVGLRDCGLLWSARAIRPAYLAIASGNACYESMPQRTLISIACFSRYPKVFHWTCIHLYVRSRYLRHGLVSTIHIIFLQTLKFTYPGQANHYHVPRLIR